jgi:DNA-binding CsgD family transcriptional regulator
VRGLAEQVLFQGPLASHDYQRGEARAEPVVADPARHSRAAVIGAHMLLADVAWAKGRAADGIEHSREAVRIAADEPVHARRVHPRLLPRPEGAVPPPSPHWSRSERPVSGWASLTDTERSVAELVAQGLTNPQVADQMFISPHTVKFHLRQVFRKLAIGSRVELARLAVEQGPAE